MNTVAIDFGTSNTVVCIQDSTIQSSRVLKLERLSRQFETVDGQVDVVPSLVFVAEEQLLFGEMVRSRAIALAQPERLFQAFKRDLAADYQPPARQIDGKTYTTELVTELFLQEIWQTLLADWHLPPERVIFTVPVGAFERYLNWFRNLAARLDLPEIQLVDEATAAALGYAVQHSGAVVLVVDFGGGTLDLSLVRTVVGGKLPWRAEVLAKADAYIGGVDIDLWIVEHCLHHIGVAQAGISKTGWLNFLEVGEQLKIQLSNATEARASWFDEQNSFLHELYVTREELEEILESRQVLHELRQALDEVLALAQSQGIRKTEIEQVLLVGGSCQIPAIQQLVISYFGRQRVKLDKPFAAVAHGALAVGQQLTVEDYLQHSYAIRLWEPFAKTYSYFPLFHKGCKYPCRRQEPLTLQVATDGQQEIRLEIGEVAEVKQAEVIYDAQGRMTSSQLNQQAEFRSLNDHGPVLSIHLDPPGQIGIDRIEVVFEVNEQRVLLATVKDLETQQVLVYRGTVAKLR